jgi:hypothetical protein
MYPTIFKLSNDISQCAIDFMKCCISLFKLSLLNNNYIQNKLNKKNMKIILIV